MQLVAGGRLTVCIDSLESGWLSSSEGGLALVVDGEARAVQLLAGGWLVAGMTMACLVQSPVATGSFPTSSCSDEVIERSAVSCWVPSSVGGSTSFDRAVTTLLVDVDVILATAGGPVYSVLLSV